MTRCAVYESAPEMALTNRDQFHFVESILENVPTSQDEAGRQLKATLDHLANTAGMPSAR